MFELAQCNFKVCFTGLSVKQCGSGLSNSIYEGPHKNERELISVFRLAYILKELGQKK